MAENAPRYCAECAVYHLPGCALREKVAALEAEKIDLLVCVSGLQADIAAHQAREQTLRQAAEVARRVLNDEHEASDYEAAFSALGFIERALAQPADHSALDAYVAEKTKELPSLQAHNLALDTIDRLQNDRDSLVWANGALGRQVTEFSDEVNKLGETIDALKAERDEARRDSDRLDWLEKSGGGNVRGTDVVKWTIEARDESVRHIREAIDAAIAGEKKP